MFRIIKRNFNKTDLKEAYDAYFDPLRNFLCYKTKDIALSEDLVQEVFINLWEKRDSIQKETVKSLLYTMANNLMLNYFEHQTVVRKHEESEIIKKQVEIETPIFKIEEKEFEVTFNQVLKKIPEGRKEVFLMNRIDGLKYLEISERLAISVKAVEKRMGIAIKIIKEAIGRKI